VVSRLPEEGVVRVREATLLGKLSKFLVGQVRLVAKAGGALERHSQHRYARPVSL
jgi:hypothetical protein